MPANIVKTPADESKWSRAKKIVSKQYAGTKVRNPDKYYAITTTIFKNMKKHAQEATMTNAFGQGYAAFMEKVAVSEEWIIKHLQGIDKNRSPLTEWRGMRGMRMLMENAQGDPKVIDTLRFMAPNAHARLSKSKNLGNLKLDGHALSDSIGLGDAINEMNAHPDGKAMAISTMKHMEDMKANEIANARGGRRPNLPTDPVQRGGAFSTSEKLMRGLKNMPGWQKALLGAGALAGAGGIGYGLYRASQPDEESEQ